MITKERFQELAKQYGLHRKAGLPDLPAKVLAAELTRDELAALCAKRLFGAHFEALKMVDKAYFNEINHGQWDLTLSHLSGKRVCGSPTGGQCPYPFEQNAGFWLKARPDLRLTEKK